jgi:predicted NAD/FAD-binding protein
MTQKSIAVIGSGISGLSAAYFLSDKFSVKIFEKNAYLGGHSNTVDVDYDGKKIAVDTGFIVFNHQTYPNLTPFFKLLDVAYEKSNMSFSVKVDGGKLEYAGTNIGTVFSQIKNAFNPKFLRMLLDIMRFNKEAENILQRQFDANYTLRNLLDDLSVKDYFRHYYLLPMSGAIWSCPLEVMLSYPAQSFVRFFKNHGLLTVADQPQWFTVSGGSREYVKKIAAKIGEKNISLNNEVIAVKRSGDKVLVKSKQGEESFDYVFFATHGDQVLSILENPNPQEKSVLSNFKYQPNLAVLHRDSSLMPKSTKAWASWVYSKNKSDLEDKISVTYWMNNLQNIDQKYPLFVTLNPNQKIAEDKIFAQFNYEHPIFDSAAVAAQSRIEQIQGLDRIYFCGAYQKYGFHEDGISSGLKAINALGIFAPWQ